MDKNQKILMIVNPGTGKTHPTCALPFAACAKGCKALFLCYGLDQGTAGRPRGKTRWLQRLQKHLKRLHLLLIDELDYITFSKVDAELLFEITSHDYEHHSLMLTSNMPFEQWAKVSTNYASLMSMSANGCEFF